MCYKKSSVLSAGAVLKRTMQTKLWRVSQLPYHVKYFPGRFCLDIPLCLWKRIYMVLICFQTQLGKETG